MQIFAAAARHAIHKNGFDDALYLIAEMHHCSISEAALIAKTVVGRQHDTISPLSDAVNELER